MHNYKTLNIRGELYSLQSPKVMGILNVTPDSFFAGSRAAAEEDICRRTLMMKEHGADIIDIGGYSSRPGADEVSVEEEKRRVALGVGCVRRVWPDAIISVDTFRADVARYAVAECGADIINDISGGDLDKDMFQTVADLKVPYILMHMRGNPQNMQSLTDYADVTADVLKDLSFKIAALRQLGVPDVIVDPGFGFAKTLEQNFELMENLEAFHSLNAPVLVGISRKSMVTRTLGVTPSEALNGTMVLNTIALMKGADILRVHDVRECAEAVKLVSALHGGINKHAV